MRKGILFFYPFLCIYVFYQLIVRTDIDTSRYMELSGFEQIVMTISLVGFLIMFIQLSWFTIYKPIWAKKKKEINHIIS